MTITYATAIDLIGTAIEDFSNGLEEIQDSIANEITFAVNNDLQIRDYLIGLPNSYPLNICAGFLETLATMVPAGERFAYDTVNAMYQYELENMNTCKTLLEMAYEANPNYSLTKLVTRVVAAGWPSDSFTTMRNELAQSVLDHINENADYIIEGGN